MSTKLRFLGKSVAGLRRRIVRGLVALHTSPESPLIFIESLKYPSGIGVWCMMCFANCRTMALLCPANPHAIDQFRMVAGPDMLIFFLGDVEAGSKSSSV